MEHTKDMAHTATQQTGIQKSVSYDPILFHNNQNIYVIFKKTEAIAGAVFLITQSIAESEVIKKSLREQGLATLNKLVGIISQSSLNVVDLQQAASSLAHLNSLLDIAFWSGVVSQMNASLIQKEIAFTLKLTNDEVAKNKNNFYLDENFFSQSFAKSNGQTDQEQVVAELAADLPKNQQNIQTPEQTHVQEIQHQAAHTQGFDKGHVKDILQQAQAVKNDKRQMPSPNTLATSPISQTSIQSSTRSSDQRDNSRRNLIISLLKRGGKYGVKDVTAFIPAVSEKTIQRELLSLVADGLIKKEGERRWSMYSI
jgi:uncharacterized membrane protein